MGRSRKSIEPGGPAAAVPALSLAERPVSLTQSVLDSLRRSILDKTLAPGQRVTESSLAVQLNVSKTPVREALLELRRVGLIENWGRRGGRVILPSRQAIREVGEMREAIEEFLARTAATRATDAQCRGFQELAARTLREAEAGNPTTFQSWNIVFHRRIAEAVGNARMTRAQDDNFAVNSLLRLRDLPPENHLLEFAHDHIAIAAAIADRDPTKAAAAAKLHAQRATTYNLASFDRLSVARTAA